MTDREKLIEILRVPIFPHEQVDPIEVVADYLLDNGVVVQRWIPASQPPTVTGEYIAMIRGDIHSTSLFYNVGDEKWFFFAEECGYDVTHWMPLPEPPKEGE